MDSIFTRTLCAWLLALLSFPTLSFTQSFMSPGGNIPNNTTGTTFNLNVNGVGTITPASGLTRVCLSIDQARPGDLDIYLESPAGDLIQLSTDNGGSSGNDYYEGLCFSACGPSGPIAGASNFRGVYSPEGSFATLNSGANGNGTWKLRIDDDNSSGTDGTLHYWSLTFGGTAMPSTPTGDDCANAYVLNLPFDHTCMTLAGSANDYNACTGNMGGADYVYAYTPTTAEEFLSIDVSQDWSAPSGFPTVTFLDTCPNLAAPVNCIQKEIQMFSYENILHVTSQPLTLGKTYYIVVASSSGTGGVYDVRINMGRNGNDDCLNATVIDHNGEYAGNNYTASIPNLQAPSTAEMTCNGSVDNFVFYTFTTDNIGSTVYVNVTDIDCNLSCGGSCGIQLALFEEPAGGACQGPGTWGPPVYCETSTETNVYYAWSGLSPNTTYYLMVDGNAGSQCVWNLQAMGDFQQTLLPVEFGSISAQHLGGANRLQWTTHSEVQTSHFEIEHALNGRDFSVIGVQTAYGGAAGGSYRFLHPEAATGNHFYRIRSIDQDGQTQLSKVVQVAVQGEAERARLYPNPASDALNFEMNTLMEVNIRIRDVRGNTVLRIEGSAARHTADISALTSGIYFAEISSPGKNRQVLRFIKR